MLGGGYGDLKHTSIFGGMGRNPEGAKRNPGQFKSMFSDQTHTISHGQHYAFDARVAPHVVVEPDHGAV
jgi:hypothetical protein